MRTIKIITVIGMLAAFFAAVVMVSAATRTTGEEQFDAGATYKAKCVACHGQKAEKKFDTTKADADHVQIVLKGKKAEKPPHMPAYEEKGITPDQASALVVYMKSIQ
ncbi:MAG: cytochrome c [Pyrinomonadaceae bacterium]|nr:cytochrome c [Pyrinomonadaceae bacterium]